MKTARRASKDVIALRPPLLARRAICKSLANLAARFDPKLRLGYKGTVAMTKEPDPEELLRQRGFLFFVLFLRPGLNRFRV